MVVKLLKSCIHICDLIQFVVEKFDYEIHWHYDAYKFLNYKNGEDEKECLKNCSSSCNRFFFFFPFGLGCWIWVIFFTYHLFRWVSGFLFPIVSFSIFDLIMSYGKCTYNKFLIGPTRVKFFKIIWAPKISIQVWDCPWSIKIILQIYTNSIVSPIAKSNLLNKF